MDALVGIIMGSQSDWDTLRHAAEMLGRLGVPHETRIVSAHRTPDRLRDYAASARQRGLRDAARPFLEDLHRASGETVHLAVLEAPDVVYLDKLTSRAAPTVPSRIGGRMPAHAGRLELRQVLLAGRTATRRRVIPKSPMLPG